MFPRCVRCGGVADPLAICGCGAPMCDECATAHDEKCPYCQLGVSEVPCPECGHTLNETHYPEKRWTDEGGNADMEPEAWSYRCPSCRWECDKCERLTLLTAPWTRGLAREVLDLRAELERLRAERDEARAEVDWRDEAAEVLGAEMRRAARAEVIVASRRVLGRVRHSRECRVNPGGSIMAALGDPEPRACTCGLDDLRAALAAIEKEVLAHREQVAAFDALRAEVKQLRAAARILAKEVEFQKSLVTATNAEIISQRIQVLEKE